MRERRKEKDAARKNPSVKKNTLREPQKMKKSRVRGFIIATVLFVFLLLVVYLVQSSQPTVLRVSDNDMMQLTAAIDNVEKEVSISSLMELTGAMAPLSVFMEDALLKINKKSEESDVAAERKNFQRPVATLHKAADAMYNAICGMILETPGAPLIGLPKGLPRTLYAWMLTTLHVFATTLPEFYLYDDEAKAEHTSTLLKSVNLLRWSEQVPNAHFFNWSKEVCQTAIPTVSGKRWLSFCQSSFSSLPAVHTREAALLEELIALYPKYAPLRLHYAVSLAFADYPVGSSVALGAVRRDKQSLKTGRYKHADGFHGSVLPLLEYILVPREELDSTILVEVGSFLSQVDCRVPSTWAPVSDTARPPLLTKRHADIISEKAKIDFPDLNFSLQNRMLSTRILSLVLACALLVSVRCEPVYDIIFSDRPLRTSDLQSTSSEDLVPVRLHNGSLYVCKTTEEETVDSEEESLTPRQKLSREQAVSLEKSLQRRKCDSAIYDHVRVVLCWAYYIGHLSSQPGGTHVHVIAVSNSYNRSYTPKPSLSLNYTVDASVVTPIQEYTYEEDFMGPHIRTDFVVPFKGTMPYFQYTSVVVKLYCASEGMQKKNFFVRELQPLVLEVQGFVEEVCGYTTAPIDSSESPIVCFPVFA